jgi:hypothetical protein
MSHPANRARRRSRRVLLATTAASLLLAGFAVPSAVATGPGGWDHIGPGTTTSTLNGATYALYPRGTDLYVGGAFSNAGGHDNADFFARWDGGAWRTVGTRLNGSVHAIAYYDGHVIVGGEFTDAGGDGALDYLARLGSNGWEPVCNAAGSAFSGSVSALRVVGSTLYVGGAFQDGAKLAAADNLVACNLVTGTPTSTVANEFDALNGVVYALTADSDGNLYAGGGFTNLLGAQTADRVAYLDTGDSGEPGTWHPMGSNGGADGAVSGFVRSLTARGTDVYIGTDALNVAGIAQADHVARWNGSAWSALGANGDGTNGWLPTSAYIYGMTTYAGMLFVTGSFQNANGNPRADNVAYFDGFSWRPLGTNGAGDGPWVGNGLALAMQHGAVHAAGNFTSAGGDTKAKYLAEFSIKRPDAFIYASGDGWAGEHVYSATGVGERVVSSVRRGNFAFAYFYVRNEGLRDDTFTVIGDRSADGFTISYKQGTTDVSAAVKNGTLARDVAAGVRGFFFNVRVDVGAHSTRAHSFRIKVKGSATRPADAVILKVKVP